MPTKFKRRLKSETDPAESFFVILCAFLLCCSSFSHRIGNRKLPNGAEVKVVAVDGRKNKFDVRVKGDVEVAPEDEEEAAKLAILLRVASRKELSDTSEEILVSLRSLLSFYHFCICSIVVGIVFE